MLPDKEDGGENRLTADEGNAFDAAFDTSSTRTVNGRSCGAGENVVRG